MCEITHPPTHTHPSTHLPTHPPTPTSTPTHPHTHARKHTCTHARTHTYTCTHTRTHTHITPYASFRCCDSNSVTKLLQESLASKILENTHASCLSYTTQSFMHLCRPVRATEYHSNNQQILSLFVAALTFSCRCLSHPLPDRGLTWRLPTKQSPLICCTRIRSPSRLSAA